MKEEILKILSGPKARTIKGICDLLNTRDRKMVLMLLEQLIKEGHIIKIDNRYGKANGFKLFKGVIDIKDGAYGFVSVEGRNDDIFVPGNALNGAFDGDTVMISTRTNMHRGVLKFEGEVKQIVERKTVIIVGTFNATNNEIISDSIKDTFRVFVTKDKTKKAQTGHKVKAHIVTYGLDQVIAEIDTILGHENDPGIDILSVLYRFDVPLDFSEETIKEANEVSFDISMNGRKDLSDKLIVTIDGADAKDFDDAISLDKLDNGNYILGVHIADVSHYVRENQPLDLDAYERGTSIYLTDRVVPMLPVILSNGICSLNPDVLRYTLTCEMEIDKLGKVISHEIYQSVIKSKARMTYEFVNLVLAKKENHKFEEFFFLMYELAQILREERFNEGSIDFLSDELDIIVDKDGKPIDIKISDRGESEKIIEEFMLLANKVVAKHFSDAKLPFIYRVHENPDGEKLANVLKIVRGLGFRADIKKEIKHHDIQRVLFELKDSDAEYPLNNLLLRSMMKARYAEKNLGHYGLAFNNYTHFTSPIRRYPDLIVHRLIRDYLINNRFTHDEKKIKKIADFASKCEKRAVDCEREVVKMKCAEYMMNYVNQEFDGMVSSITSFGIFVKLANGIEGLVSMYNLNGVYAFDEKKMMLVSMNNRIKLGDKIRIRVLKASKVEGNIDFIKVG